MNLFKVLIYFNTLLFIYLAGTLLLDSPGFFQSVGVEASLSGILIARRAAIFFIASAFLLFYNRNAIGKQQQSIDLFMSILMLGLPITGSYELIQGNFNKGIIPAIIIELMVGVSFLVLFLKNHHHQKQMIKEREN